MRGVVFADTVVRVGIRLGAAGTQLRRGHCSGALRLCTGSLDEIAGILFVVKVEVAFEGELEQCL